MDGSCTSVQQLPALQYAAADASPRSNIPDVSSDANGVMSAEAADEGASDAAAARCPASCIADDSSLGCAAKVNTGSGGGGGGANSDASAAAWSANIGAGGDTSTVEKGFVAWWLVKGAMLFDDGVVGAGAVAAAVGLALPLPLLLERGEDAEARRGVLASAAAADVGVDGAEEDDDDAAGEERLALRHPPPTGTLRRTPPLVQ
ncbi:unnamed protein product [Urochloa decumbens]|uniref:Uncharacterized protein n=1 Tax=Urochloa decumbens TaxID=240449 RepID=A0ABC9EC80_9POAL